MKTYRVAGTTDDVTTCELCSRPELKGTVIMVSLDADGNDEGVSYFGTSCAAKAAGWTVRSVKAGIASAQRAVEDAKRQEREAAQKIQDDAFTDWKITRFGTADVEKIRKIAREQGTTYARITDGFSAEWNAR
jgi:hypothetical protein